MSDCMLELLRSLHACAALNSPDMVATRQMQARMVDWSLEANNENGPLSSAPAGSGASAMNDGEFRTLGGEQFDLVIASDILYEDNFASWIPRLVRRRSRPRVDSRDIGSLAFVCVSPPRDLNILNAFTNNLVREGFHVKVVSATDASRPRSDIRQKDGVLGRWYLNAKEGADCCIFLCWL